MGLIDPKSIHKFNNEVGKKGYVVFQVRFIGQSMTRQVHCIYLILITQNTEIEVPGFQKFTKAVD